MRICVNLKIIGVKYIYTRCGHETIGIIIIYTCSGYGFIDIIDIYAWSASKPIPTATAPEPMPTATRPKPIQIQQHLNLYGLDMVGLI